MNLYEIHSHTSEVSACSNVTSKELVFNHKKNNFKGVCITDHYYKGFLTIFMGEIINLLLNAF